MQVKRDVQKFEPITLLIESQVELNIIVIALGNMSSHDIRIELENCGLESTDCGKVHTKIYEQLRGFQK